MSNNFIQRNSFKTAVVVAATIAMHCPAIMAQQKSAATTRFRTQGLKYEQDNEFYTGFKTSSAIGLGYEEGIVRRDPTDVIKVGDLYYVWYTRTAKGPAHVGLDKATDTLRAYSWDLADLWCATSSNGKTWTERGVAVRRGPKGSFDARSVFTPNVLVANGRFYLFYQAAADLSQGQGGDFAGNVIAMSWADSPDGPWIKAPEPMLKTGPEGAFDHRNVHDPSLIVREGKYWLYYKGHPGGPTGRDKRWGVPIAWGVAVADKPEGTYVKSKLNPVICGGHEVIVWPYRKGVCALLVQGPERNSLQYAEDGLNFAPKAHGLDTPRAAGVYRADNFFDTDKQPGPGITWGLFHARRDRWHYLMWFDCNLSLKRGEQINERLKRIAQHLEKDKENSQNRP